MLAKRLWVVTKLINQAVGDALSGLLLVEAILQHMGWPVDKWNELYQDLPSRQLKLLQDLNAGQIVITYDNVSIDTTAIGFKRRRFGSALNIKTLVAAAERRKTPIDETVKGHSLSLEGLGPDCIFHLATGMPNGRVAPMVEPSALQCETARGYSIPSSHLTYFFVVGLFIIKVPTQHKIHVDPLDEQ
ncbi:hypothetical protein Tco_1194179 [Tanacetum coccineum]